MDHQVSPFYSRAYGGYTQSQISFYKERIGNPTRIEILDPMAGQAFALSQLALDGAKVYLGDLNPAPLLLASLRDPRFIKDRVRLCGWFESVLSQLRKRRRPKAKSIVVSDWLSDNLKVDLNSLSATLGIGLFVNLGVRDFWLNDCETRFALGIVCLSARQLVCYRKSDNIAWLMPGGVDKNPKLADVLRESLHQWFEWAESVHLSKDSAKFGTVSTHLLNIETNSNAYGKKFDVVVTSPPYANRLDYTRLWGPETAVISYLSGSSIHEIKPLLMGTTCVAGTGEYEAELKKLPSVIRRNLFTIRDDKERYSKSYYYPFFRNYAVALMKGLENAATQLRPGGSLFVFVRDTVRKDVLFPTGELVQRVLTKKAIGMLHVESERQVIKAHIGNVRQGSTSGVYGKAQLEWWMHFRKI